MFSTGTRGWEYLQLLTIHQRLGKASYHHGGLLLGFDGGCGGNRSGIAFNFDTGPRFEPPPSFIFEASVINKVHLYQCSQYCKNALAALPELKRLNKHRQNLLKLLFKYTWRWRWPRGRPRLLPCSLGGRWTCCWQSWPPRSRGCWTVSRANLGGQVDDADERWPGSEPAE